MLFHFGVQGNTTEGATRKRNCQRKQNGSRGEHFWLRFVRQACGKITATPAAAGDGDKVDADEAARRRNDGGSNEAQKSPATLFNPIFIGYSVWNLFINKTEKIIDMLKFC